MEPVEQSFSFSVEQPLCLALGLTLLGTHQHSGSYKRGRHPLPERIPILVAEQQPYCYALRGSYLDTHKYAQLLTVKSREW